MACCKARLSRVWRRRSYSDSNISLQNLKFSRVKQQYSQKLRKAILHRHLFLLCYKNDTRGILCSSRTVNLRIVTVLSHFETKYSQVVVCERQVEPNVCAPKPPVSYSQEVRKRGSVLRTLIQRTI